MRVIRRCGDAVSERGVRVCAYVSAWVFFAMGILKRRRVSTKKLPASTIAELHETLANDLDTKTASGLKRWVDGLTVSVALALKVYHIDIGAMNASQVRRLHDELLRKLYNIRVRRAERVQVDVGCSLLSEGNGADGVEKDGDGSNQDRSHSESDGAGHVRKYTGLA